MRENALIVASLLTLSRDPSPLLCYPIVYKLLPGNKQGDVMRRDERLVTARLGSAWFGSAHFCNVRQGENSASSAVA
jgi:hypothetical protein